MKNPEPVQQPSKKAAPRTVATKRGAAAKPVKRASAPPVKRASAPRAAAKARAAAGDAGGVDPRLAAVLQALASDPQVTYGGKGFGSTALKRNGKIFAMLDSKGGFVVKLPKARVDELVAAGKGSYFDPGHGRLMKEWLALGSKPTTWLELAKEAHRSIATRQA